jgi:hypothetical protein
MSKTVVRPEIDLVDDGRLRLFIDTNVLVDFAEGLDEKSCGRFLELFAQKKFDNIELVTSDYVLWEFYGHFRDELYVRKLVKEHHYGYVSANRECSRRAKYRKATPRDMNIFGKTIQSKVKQFADSPVSIQRLIGKRLDGFSEIVDAILQRSKFSYKDTIVFVSALFTQSQIVVTCDEDFSTESHLESVKEALESLNRSFSPEIQFLKPEEMSSVKKVETIYKNWFIKNNKRKQIGVLTKIWPKANSIAIECKSGNFVEVGDYLCLVRFHMGTKFASKVIRVEEGNLRDYDTDKKVTRGGKITIRLAQDCSIEPNMAGAMVFLHVG